MRVSSYCIMQLRCSSIAVLLCVRSSLVPVARLVRTKRQPEHIECEHNSNNFSRRSTTPHACMCVSGTIMDQTGTRMQGTHVFTKEGAKTIDSKGPSAHRESRPNNWKQGKHGDRMTV